MIKFLIHRPIAVIMTYLGIIALGLVAAKHLPVTLVPDVDIPRISVRIHAPGYSARQIEAVMLQRLRMHLMQVNNLHELRSEARDGSGLISLELDHGTNVDLAYIEINEQVDKALPGLPRDLLRPAVIKASATDIPIFFLDITLKDTPVGGARSTGAVSDQEFLELSNFVDEVIRRRLEQLPQVAMADLSGRSYSEIVVTPRMEMLRAMGMPISVVEDAIVQGNLTLGNIILRDKQFQYHVRVGRQLLGAADIGRLFVHHQGRVWQLSDLATIETRLSEPQGMVYSQHNRSISLAIIQQSGARMQDLQRELHSLVQHFQQDYPHLQFTITRDQTRLLDITMASLTQTLVIGAILAFLVMFLFLRDNRAPWLIMLTVPTALVISLLFFHLVGISINIISISGLILAVGMMIDNSIIVIDNISRLRKKENSLEQACVKGANEVFTPLLSSVLTTCSVFVPLIFISGLAGALFFDQALAVSIGLMASLAVAFTLIPVLYFAIHKAKPVVGESLLMKFNPINYQKLYSKGFRFVMRNQIAVWIIFGLFLSMLVVSTVVIDRERLPNLERQAVLVWVDWNENIHIDENRRRVNKLLHSLGDEVIQHAAQVGQQQFLLENLRKTNPQQSLVYILTRSERDLYIVEDQIRNFFSINYPNALVDMREDGNVFDQVFGDRQPPLEVRLRPIKQPGPHLLPHLQATLDTLRRALPHLDIQPLPLRPNILFTANTELLTLHQVEIASLTSSLRRTFGENIVLSLPTGGASLPVKVGGGITGIAQMSLAGTVTNTVGVEIPLNLLIQRSMTKDLPTVMAGPQGEYFPVQLDIQQNQLESTTQTIRNSLRENGFFEADLTGGIFAQQELLSELLFIGAVALMLLFFILAAQFESIKMPFIVLIEVPLAISGALLMLMLFGATINLMSMIGMVVTAGIVINDSILKIATINRLRTEGMSLIRALVTAGHYRLKPILMTSITTIFALLPVLFIGGIGTDLQKPLALAVIGGLGLGTLVSLYFIPLFYFYLYRGRKV